VDQLVDEIGSVEGQISIVVRFGVWFTNDLKFCYASTADTFEEGLEFFVGDADVDFGDEEFLHDFCVDDGIVHQFGSVRVNHGGKDFVRTSTLQRVEI